MTFTLKMDQMLADQLRKQAVARGVRGAHTR